MCSSICSVLPIRVGVIPGLWWLDDTAGLIGDVCVLIVTYPVGAAPLFSWFDNGTGRLVDVTPLRRTGLSMTRT